MIKKALQGLVVSVALVMIVAWDRLEILGEPKILILIAMAVIASIYQPDYHPFRLRAAQTDRGTALQIIWSVYLSQLLAAVESFRWRYPESLEFTPSSFVFLGLGLFGLFLRTWSYLTLGRFFTWHVEVQSGQRVVTSGPYRWLRHPSYTGAFLTYASNPFFLDAPVAGGASIALLFFAFWRRIRHEEILLNAEFGREYADFCKSRWRFLPGIW